MRAEIRHRQPLLYTDAPQPGRPPHVRAGSALVWLGPRLGVVADDCLWLARVTVSGQPGVVRAVDAVPLPAVAGRRVFDLAHKRQKPDLEAALVLDGQLIALGSGSAPGRNRWLRVDLAPDGDVGPATWHPVDDLYAALAARSDFAGSALNLEGAAVAGDVLWLLNRGNGAPVAGQLPVNALGALRLADVRPWLAGQGPVPMLAQVVPLDPGTIDGVPLTTTDVHALPDGRLLILAAAEASPDAVADGEVVGAALGLWSADAATWTVLREDGARFLGKPEGLVVDPDDPQRGWVVLDADDPDRPTALCQLVWSP